MGNERDAVLFSQTPKRTGEKRLSRFASSGGEPVWRPHCVRCQALGSALASGAVCLSLLSCLPLCAHCHIETSRPRDPGEPHEATLPGNRAAVGRDPSSPQGTGLSRAPSIPSSSRVSCWEALGGYGRAISPCRDCCHAVAPHEGPQICYFHGRLR